MTDKEKKIKQIVMWRKSGITYQEIGRRLNLSLERIRQIYLSNEQKCLNREKLVQIIMKIKSPEGLNYLWPTEEFINAFEFENVTGVLLSHLRRYGYHEISFQEFIDIFLPIEEEYSDPSPLTKLLHKVRGMGIIKHAKIIKRLNEIDFGDAINAEIHERTLRIRGQRKRKVEIFSFEKNHPKIMKQLMSENGLTITWPVKEFILAVGFGNLNDVLIDNIVRFLSDEITFTQFLDFFIPPNEKLEKSIWDSIYAFRFRKIGIKKYVLVVNRLLELDFGAKINKMIRERILNILNRFPDDKFLKEINLKNN